MSEQFQFLFDQAIQDHISVTALIKDESIWLTQKGIAKLFGVYKSDITVT